MTKRDLTGALAALGLTIAAVGALAAPSMAAGPQDRHDGRTNIREIQKDKQELRKDIRQGNHRDIPGDKRELRKDVRDLHNDHRDRFRGRSDDHRRDDHRKDRHDHHDNGRHNGWDRDHH